MKNLTIGLVLITFASCNTQKKMEQSSNMEKSEIENVHWSLIEFDGKHIPESIVGKVHIELSDKDNRLSGSNGCNLLMGSYEINNDTQISISKVGSTMMACHSEDWNENEFNKVLETADNFSVSGDKLMLNVGRRMALAVFVKVRDNGIANKYWKLKKLAGKEIEMATNQEREQYFIIQDDGTITGFAGCNQFAGNSILEKDNLRIRFENVLSTLRACPDVQVSESQFLKVFELTDNYTINGNNLMLNIGRRAPLAEFEAIYF